MLSTPLLKIKSRNEKFNIFNKKFLIKVRNIWLNLVDFVEYFYVIMYDMRGVDNMTWAVISFVTIRNPHVSH